VSPKQIRLALLVVAIFLFLITMLGRVNVVG
jgi:hypothetical protein